MRFTSAEEAQSSTTRATALTSGFMVSCYKATSGTQQTVMNQYKVDYRVDGWANTKQWNYIGVDVDGIAQKEKYWDYSNFPYRFNAIAPYPTVKTGFVVSDNKLNINAPYKAQQVSDGVVTNIDGTSDIAEPHMVAQVKRDNDGKDYDIFVGGTDNQIINATNSTTLNRDVALPFHHLNSKVRFGVYSLNPWATDNKLYIKDLTITATTESGSNFVTAASKYEATGTDSWKNASGNSGFTGLTKVTNAQLLSFSGLDASNNVLEDNDLRKHQGQSSAYFLQCPDGIMQIPQEGVKMSVSLKLMQEGSSEVFKTYTNVPVILKLEDNSTQDKFNWVSGNIYTYYLILDFDQKLEIQFTATLAPWEDISGSLSTDLEK